MDPRPGTRTRAGQALICLDAFHVVVWAMKALDKVRVRTMTRAGITDRRAMWATRKNPADLTTEQRTSLAEIAVTNEALYRAYLLKEQLREVFRAKGTDGRQLLAGWLSWASHSRIAEFVDLARSIRRYRDLIGNALDHGLSNARSEATNTHLRAFTKRAYGFHSPDALIGHGPAHPRRPLPSTTRTEMTQRQRQYEKGAHGVGGSSPGRATHASPTVNCRSPPTATPTTSGGRDRNAPRGAGAPRAYG